MITVFMVLHFIIAVFLVGVILLQKSESSALGGLSGGMGGVMGARGAANFLTHATSILATAFFATSLILAILFKNSGETKSIVDEDESILVTEPLEKKAPVDK